MFNKHLVRDTLGQYYKIHLTKDGPVPDSLQAETFVTKTQAQQFINKLLVPCGYWEKVYCQYRDSKTKPASRSFIIDDLSLLLKNGKIQAYKANDPRSLMNEQDKSLMKHSDKTYYKLESSNVLLTETRDVKSFNNEQEAAAFIKQLAPSDDLLKDLADDLNIPDISNETSGDNSQEKVFGAIARALSRGAAILSVKKAESAPPVNESSDEAVSEATDKKADLAPPTEDKQVEEEEYKLVKLLPDNSEYKQYVNLQPGSSDNTLGRNVILEAHIDKPESGVTVYFKLVADPKNKENLPARMKSTGLADSMKEQDTVITATTNAEGVAFANVKISTFGGDKFQGIASLNEECNEDDSNNVKSAWITVWRKLWYQLTHHKKLTPPSMSSSISKFKNVFIELASEPAVTHEKAENGKVIVGSHNASDYHSLHNNLHSGQSVHIILCDQQIDGSPGKVIDVESEFTTDNNFIDVVGDRTVILFDPPLSGDKLLVSGSWVNSNTGKSGSLTGDKSKATDDIGYCIYNNENFVEIKLPKNSTPSETDPVTVSISIKAASGPWGGDGGTEPHNLIVIDSSDTIHTMCVMHEIGHLINMAPMKHRVNCPDGFEYDDHPNMYESNGAHCYSGGSLVTDSNGDSIGDGGTCIMYHQLNYDCKLDYCEYCTPFVKAMKLKTFKDLSK